MKQMFYFLGKLWQHNSAALLKQQRFLGIAMSFLFFTSSSPLLLAQQDSLQLGLRELGDRSVGDYEEQNNSGIENKALNDLNLSAAQLKAIVTAAGITNFKVFDYTAYSLMGRFKEPQKWNDWAFNTMDSLIRNGPSPKYGYQHYLLIGKEINPSDGKVKFRVKLSLPTVANGNRPSGDRSVSQWNSLTKNSLKNIEKDIDLLTVQEQKLQGDFFDKSGDIQKKQLERLKEIFERITRGDYGPYFCLTPSGHIIKLTYDRWIVEPNVLSGAIYGWEEDGIKYNADIRSDGKFYGYKYKSSDGTTKYSSGETDNFLTVDKIYFLKYIPDSCKAKSYEITNTSDYPSLKSIVNAENSITDGVALKDLSALFANTATKNRWPVLNCSLTPEAQNIYDNNVSKLIPVINGKKDASADAMLKAICMELSQMPQELQKDFVWANNRKYNKEEVPSIFVQYENKLRSFDELYAFWKKINDFNYAYTQFKSKIDALPCITNPNIDCDNATAREELIKFIRDKFVDDYFVGVVPTGKTLLEGPFKLLSLNQRVALFKLMVNGTMGGAWTTGGNKGPEDIAMMAIVNTPDKDKPNLLSAIGEKSIIKMLKGMDGLNAWQLVVVNDFLSDIWRANNKTDFSLTANKLFLNRPQKSKLYIDIENDEIIVTAIIYSNYPTAFESKKIKINPFEQVIFKTTVPLTIGDYTYLPNISYRMTGMSFYVFLNSKFSQEIKDAAKITLEIVAIISFYGEVKAALTIGNWFKAAAYMTDIGVTLGDNVMQDKINNTQWMSIPENKEFAEKYLNCSATWFLCRTPYWVADALNGLAKTKLLNEAEKTAIEAKLLAFSEDIDLLAEGLKSRVLARVEAEKAAFSWTYTDIELKNLVTTAVGLKIDAQTIEDMLYIACRNDKPLSFTILNEQFSDYIKVLDQKYPFRFNNLIEFQSFQKEIRTQLDQLIKSKYSVKIQGSSVRYRLANDVDVAVEISEMEFKNILFNRFHERATLSDGTKISLIGKSDTEIETLVDAILANKSSYNGQAYSFAFAMKKGKFSSKSSDNILAGLHNITKDLAQKHPNINLSNIQIEVQNGSFDLLPNIKF